MSKLTFKEEAGAVATPPAGYVRLYAKTDGLLYFKDDAGTEWAVKGGVAVTDIDTLAKLNAIVTDATLVDTGDIVLIAATSLVGTGFFLDEDNMASDDAAKVPSQQSVKAYVDNAVTGLFEDKGNYDASTNTPDLDTSPSGILKGDVYTVSVAGTFFTEDVDVGDVLRALQDAPTALAHWARTQFNIVNAIVDADFSAAEGMMRKTGAGTYEAIKNNFAAVDAPDANDDSSAGYGIGSKWHDTVAKLVHTCIDASVGAAVWAVGGGGLKPVFIAVGDSPYAANAGEIVFCDTSGGAITVTLPAAPLDTDNIWVIGQADAGTYNVTIGRNGKTILGAAADFVIDQAWGDANLAYESASGDWWGNIHGTPSLVEAQINQLIADAATAGDWQSEAQVDARVALYAPASGTFTPTLWDDSLSDAESQTYTTQSGRYRKIGDLVHFWLDITVNSLGSLTGTDQAHIGGLPFAPSTQIGAAVSIGLAQSMAITANQVVSGFVSGATGAVNLFLWDATTGTTNLLISEFSDGGRVMISGSYYTA